MMEEHHVAVGVVGILVVGYAKKKKSIGVMVDGNQNTDAGNYQSNIVVGKSSRRKLPKSEGFTKKLKHFNKI